MKTQYKKNTVFAGLKLSMYTCKNKNDLRKSRDGK